jgi:hypothetical protein
MRKAQPLAVSVPQDVAATGSHLGLSTQPLTDNSFVFPLFSSLKVVSLPADATHLTPALSNLGPADSFLVASRDGKALDALDQS